jgi:hypothetical protein
MGDLVLNVSAEQPTATPFLPKAKGGHWRDRVKKNKRQREVTNAGNEPKRQKLHPDSLGRRTAVFSCLR